MPLMSYNTRYISKNAKSKQMNKYLTFDLHKNLIPFFYIFVGKLSDS